MNKKEAAEIDLIAERLYSLNASLSAQFIGLGRKPTKNEMININALLGITIKQLRDLIEVKG